MGLRKFWPQEFSLYFWLIQPLMESLSKRKAQKKLLIFDRHSPQWIHALMNLNKLNWDYQKTLKITTSQGSPKAPTEDQSETVCVGKQEPLILDTDIVTGLYKVFLKWHQLETQLKWFMPAGKSRWCMFPPNSAFSDVTLRV